jgi:hypothetical protein
MKKLLIGLLALGSISVFAQSSSYDKALKLKDARISCQHYTLKLEDLLSQRPLNMRAIEMLRDLLVDCIDDVKTAIDNGPSSVEALVTELYSKRLVCDLEKRKIEELLSQEAGSLDYAAITVAKKELDTCKSKAFDILNH